MARFFVAASNIAGGVAYIGGKDYEHIKVLRIRNGEMFTICDGEGTDYECRLADVQGSAAVAEVISSAPSRAEPSVYCTVYAAWPKGDKAETIVQKSVEVGASEIVFFPSARCVSKVDTAGAVKKLARLCRIAEEAAKQSGRGIIPTVSAAESFDAAVKRAAGADLPLFLYEMERGKGIKSAVHAVPGAKTAAVVTGPEGGFEPEEVEAAVAAGLVSVGLGPRILRCETAPVCALAALMALTDNFGDEPRENEEA